MYMGSLERAFVPIGRRGDAQHIPHSLDAAAEEALALEETAAYGMYQRSISARAAPMRG
jgi:hypothetical protein